MSYFGRAGHIIGSEPSNSSLLKQFAMLYLLVTRNTKLKFANGPKHTLKKGLVLHVALDSPDDEYIAQAVEDLQAKPESFKVADGFDFAFSRRMYPDILEYTTWDSLKAAARMIGR